MPNPITILLPHGELPAATGRLAPRLASLAGKRIGFADNALWQSTNVIVDELTKVLTAEYGVAGVEKVVYQYTRGNSAAEFREKLQALAGRVDAVVSGLGN